MGDSTRRLRVRDCYPWSPRGLIVRSEVLFNRSFQDLYLEPSCPRYRFGRGPRVFASSEVRKVSGMGVSDRQGGKRTVHP